MRHIILFLSTCILLFAAEIKIATYNVENLFDGVDNGSEYSDFRIKNGNWNTQLYKEKLARINQVILSLNADIIALEEIENISVLQDVARSCGYSYTAFVKEPLAPIGLGIISKIKLIDFDNFKVAGVKTRDILKAKFNFNDEEFSIFVVHFPAGARSIENKKRAAFTLKRAVGDTPKSIILGDFNSNFGNNFILDGIIDDNKFLNLWQLLPASRRKSHVTGGSMDHILISKDFLKNSKLTYKKGSFGVYKADFMLDEFNKVKKINSQNAYSDHYPLFFSLSTNQVQDEIASEPKSMLLNEIYGKTALNFPLIVEKAAIIYKDKFGFVIAQKDKKGVYVYEPKNSFKLGEVHDFRINSTDFYKENFQITSLKSLKQHPNVDIKDFMISKNFLKNSRSGDVICEISGDVKGGYLYTEFGKIKIFSLSSTITDQKGASFEEAKVVNYRGEKELVVR